MTTLTADVEETITFSDAQSFGSIGIIVNEIIAFQDTFIAAARGPFTTCTRFVNPYPQYKDYNGIPYSFGFLYTYAANTDTPLATYADVGMTIQNPDPIQLDARGSPGSMFLIPGAIYKVILTDKNGDQIWMREYVQPFAGTAPPPPPPPPPAPPPPCAIANVLDGLSVTPTGAYSTRKLRAAYAGPALRVHRRSDNHELDIGFGGDCSLDNNALLTFCAGTDCAIAKWYDQSGNGNDVVSFAGSSTDTPRIVTAGALTITVNGHTATLGIANVGPGTGGNWLTTQFSPVMLTASQGSMFAVGNATSGGTPASGISWKSLPCICGADADFSGNGNMVGISFAQTAASPVTLVPSMVTWRFQGNTVFANIDMHEETSYTYGTNASFAMRYNSADAPNVAKGYVGGGTPAINTNAALANGPNVNFVIGNGGNQVQNASFIGTIAEVLVFGTELSLTDSNYLGSNQGTYWGVSWSNITV